MAINTRAFDWSTNNFGFAEWDDIGWSFSELGSGQFFNSYSVDNFTPKDSPDDFTYTSVSSASSPGLSGVSAALSPSYTSVSINSASYTSSSVGSAVFTDLVIAGES
jgi:hypothetical protein|tara:strand:+ start:98 stop:418 length:321 start_codon:yes stop_codon:yes gene_type:complete